MSLISHNSTTIEITKSYCDQHLLHIVDSKLYLFVRKKVWNFLNHNLIWAFLSTILSSVKLNILSFNMCTYEYFVAPMSTLNSIGPSHSSWSNLKWLWRRYYCTYSNILTLTRCLMPMYVLCYQGKQHTKSRYMSFKVQSKYLMVINDVCR